MNDPLQLLAHPRSAQSAEVVACALETHLRTGESLDTILGLSSAGYSTISARRQYLSTLRGNDLIIAWYSLREQLSPRDASDTLYDCIANGRTPPEGLSELISEIRELSTQLDSRMNSRRAFYQRLRQAEATARA